MAEVKYKNVADHMANDDTDGVASREPSYLAANLQISTGPACCWAVEVNTDDDRIGGNRVARALCQQLGDIHMVMAGQETAEQHCVNSLNSLKTGTD